MNPAARLFLFRFRREVRRGALPIWILEELSRGPTYGYALLSRLDARAGAPGSVGPSTLYPALGRLRAAGLVRGFHGTTSQGPLRKYYELTDEGRSVLPVVRDSWLDLRASRPGRVPAPRGRTSPA